METIAVEIRPLVEHELALLEQHIGFDWASARRHRDRLARQREGKVVYFVAWLGDLPVGHGLLKWEGSEDEPIASGLDRCPNVEDLFVIPDQRSRGIGSQLLGRAERLAVRHGFPQIGLSVAVDNPRARSLYERRGYKDAGFSQYETRWSYLDREGRERQVRDLSYYLVKRLG